MATDPRISKIVKKIAVSNVNDQSFSMLADESTPTPDEKEQIAIWADLRNKCLDKRQEFDRLFISPQILSLMRAGRSAADRLMTELYNGRLTYGQFSKLRRENADLMNSSIAIVQSELKKQSSEATARAQEISNQSSRIILEAARVENEQRAATAIERQSRAIERQATLPQNTTTFCHRSGSDVVCQSSR